MSYDPGTKKLLQSIRQLTTDLNKVNLTAEEKQNILQAFSELPEVVEVVEAASIPQATTTQQNEEIKRGMKLLISSCKKYRDLLDKDIHDYESVVENLETMGGKL